MGSLREWLFAKKPLDEAASKKPPEKPAGVSMDQSYLRRAIQKRHPAPAPEKPEQPKKKPYK